ncbi:MAG: hypothetical protein MI864_08410 [Pseudomonadales bacterium]|nr:hypothetical protein [Pseudomonadales bacterium]
MSFRHAISVLKYGLVTVRAGLFLAVVLAALYVILGRQFLPVISHYSDDLEQQLSTLLGTPVQIGELSGSWVGLNPVIKVEQLYVLDKLTRSTSVQLESLSVEFSLIDTVKTWSFKLKDLRVDGVSLRVIQNDDGHWRFSGFPVAMAEEPPVISNADTVTGASATPDLPALLETYLVYPYVEVSHIRLDIEAREGSAYQWEIPRAQLTYQGDKLKASGEVLITGQAKPFAQFSLVGRGRLLSEDMVAEIYASWQTQNALDPYLEGYELMGLDISEVDARGQLWLDLEGSRVKSVRSVLDLNRVMLSAEGEAIQPFTQGHLDLSWHDTPSGWVARVGEFQINWGDQRWQPSHFEIAKEGQRWVVLASYLDLGFISRAGQMLGGLPDRLSASLSGYQPAGLLRNAHFLYANEDSEVTYTLQSELDDVSVAAYDGAPYLAHVNGLLDLNHRGGRVIFSSPDFKMGFPELFDESWAFELGQGEVYWSLADTIRVAADAIRLDYGTGAHLLGKFSLELPRNSPSTFLSLEIQGQNLQAADVPEFVPRHVVDSGIYQWLESAFTAGTVNGLFLGEGNVGSNAPHGSFATNMDFALERGVVHFAEGWPNALDVSSRVMIDRGGLQVALASAELVDVNLTDVRVSKRFSDTEAPPLMISIQERLSGEDLHALLTRLPFRGSTAPVADQMQLVGELDTAVDVKLPLGNTGEPQIAVALNTVGSNLILPGANLQFSALDGEIRYSSESGINGKLAGELLGESIQIGIDSHLDRGEMMSRVSMRGQASLSQLASWQDMDLPEFMSGELSYLAELSVLPEVSGEPKLKLRLESDLMGLEVAMPAPLNKPKTSARRFEYTHYIQGYDRYDEFSYGSVLTGRAWEISGQPAILVNFLDVTGQSSVARSQGLEVEMVDSPGVWIGGELDYLNLDPWFEWLKSDHDIENDSIGFNLLSLFIADLEVAGFSFPGQSFDVIPVKRGWMISGLGPHLEGSIQSSGDDGQIDVDLNRLVLSTVNQATASQSVVMMEPPETFPNITASVDTLRWQDRELGSWNFAVRSSPDSIVLDPLIASLGDSRFSGRYSWRWDVNTLDSVSIFSGAVDAVNTAQLVQSIGMTPSLDSAQSHIDAALAWPGGPDQFSLQGVSGKLAVMMQEGTFFEASPGTEALRLFGILNMDTLSRRLQLDFSDLTDRGIAFDLLEASATIDSGMLDLQTPLVIQGPSNILKFTGKTNLDTQVLDMDMVVVLPLTKNLPLAALMIGAPQVGGALWVIDKLLGDPLSRITSATYRVGGTWGEPDVSLKNVFDNSPLELDEPKVVSRRKDEVE